MTLLSIRVQLEVLELPKTSRLTFGAGGLKRYRDFVNYFMPVSHPDG